MQAKKNIGIKLFETMFFLMELCLMKLIHYVFFTKNAVDIRPYFLTVPNGSL